MDIFLVWTVIFHKRAWPAWPITLCFKCIVGKSSWNRIKGFCRVCSSVFQHFMFLDVLRINKKRKRKKENGQKKKNLWETMNSGNV